MTARYSRLARNEERNYLKKSLMFVFLTIAGIIFLLFMGIPIFSKIAGFVSSFKESDVVVSTNDNTPPPPPRIESLPEYTNETRLQVSGSTEAGATITLHFNEEVKEIITNADGGFSTSFTLSEGENTFFAYSTDSAGNKSVQSKSYSIIFDKEPPELEIIKPTNGESFFGTTQKQINIEGQTEAGSRVYINDRVVVVNSSGKFVLPISLNDGENIFIITSTDRSGNKTELELAVNYSL